jgi:hypothetical protein
MNTLRVSSTDLDKYRRFRADEDADLATFLAELREPFRQTPAMAAGTALHGFLELADAVDTAEITLTSGHTFVFDCDASIDLPPIRECKQTGEYQIGDCLVTLVAKVDAVHGKRIDDHKFTGSYDAERFLSSFQWRCYLDIFGADEFRWNVFEGREEAPEGSKRYRITNVHQLSAWRYPTMREDVERELGLFVEFARQCLPERFKRAA